MADRNVVVVSVDSLRADHCGCYGYPGRTTPHLDELAADGVVYERAVAPGPTTPKSMPAVFTGNGAFEKFRDHDARRRSVRDHLAALPTLAERFRERGYRTVGFTPNPFTSRHFGFDAGFDRFEDFLGARTGLRRRVLGRWLRGEPVAGLRFALNMLGEGDVSTTWEAYYDDVLAALRGGDRPYFCWVFLLEPHWPYRPPRRYRAGGPASAYYDNWLASNLSEATPGGTAAARLRALYDGAVRHADEFLGRLRDDAPGDPIVVVHADHGEAFGEHDTFGHRQRLYEENVRVPLVVSGPGVDAERVADPVSLRALPEVALDAAAETADWASHASPCVTTEAEARAAVRGRDWKYVAGPDGDRVFDLRDDPLERRPRDPDEEFRTRCERLLARRGAIDGERRAVAGAAGEVADRA